MRFNPPPNWPQPPPGWQPPAGWTPDPSWPPLPEGWQLWIEDPNEAPVENEATSESATDSVDTPTAAPQSDAAAAVDLDDQRVLQEGGIYRYHHPLEDAAAYRDRLTALNTQVTEMVKAGNAILAATSFTLDNSLAKGKRMVSDLSKLTLRAYNAEADNCVRSLRNGNIATATKRLEHSMTAIEKLGSLMQLRINPDYHGLRVQELQLTADWQMKKIEEREQAREERQALREQQKVEAELAAERERLDKERAHYQTALAALDDVDPASQDLRARLTEIDRAIADNDYRAANIRAGYVYVISNIGTFGPDVVKIGLTRRLEPRDRVRDLGDASVPFHYDVHALFFSDDAVTLERELHETFADRRLNHVNLRREFFFATPQEVRQVLESKVGGLLEFHENPEAVEYNQSITSWPTRR